MQKCGYILQVTEVTRSDCFSAAVGYSQNEHVATGHSISLEMLPILLKIENYIKKFAVIMTHNGEMK